MNWRQILLLYRKEILEFIRDKRTFMVMVLIPALLYPGIIMVTAELAVKQIQEQSKKKYTVGVHQDFLDIELVKKISSDENLIIESGVRADFDKYKVFIHPAKYFSENLENYQAAEITISYQSANNDSIYVRDKIENIIRDFNKEIVNQRLTDKGLTNDFINPVKIIEDKTDKEVESQFLAGSILPGIMLIMLSVGCSLIGQEIAAGEKEKSTLETILCSPLSRLELICGKYLTVVTVGFSSALINLGCMSLTIANFASLMGDNTTSVFSDYKIPFSSFPIIIISLLLVSLLVAGLTLIASSIARTVQEAGYYLAPITLVLSLPVIISRLPGIELEGAYRFVPFLNFCLLFKELMILKATYFDIFAVLFSTGIFTIISIIILIKIYNSEEILFNHESKSSLSFKRVNLTVKNSLEAEDAILAYLVMLPVYFFVMVNLQKINLTLSMIVSQWGLFFLLTILLLSYFKINLKNSLSLRNPGAKNLLICLLLTPLCYLVTIYLEIALKALGLSGYEQETDIIELLTDKYGLIGVLAIISLTPAICEEFFFRGVILSGIRKEYSLKTCVLLQAVMFGVAHYSIFRFAGTAVMGAFLTIVLFRTGSIFCTILMHFIFNSTSCLLVYGLAEDKKIGEIFIQNFWILIFVFPLIFILIKNLKLTESAKCEN